MARGVVAAVFAAVLVAGCGTGEQANQANESGNAVMPSAETRTDSTPLTHDQALAVMKEREHHMEAFGDEAKKISTTLKSSSPDVQQIQQSAAKIAELAPKLQSWFPKGTGPDVGKTRAKPELWQKPEDFTLKAHDLEVAAQEFKVAADSGDLSRIKPAFAALGKACKACHDLYRAPKKD